MDRARRVGLSDRERSGAPTRACRGPPARRQPLLSAGAAARPRERLSSRLATVLLGAAGMFALAGCGAGAASTVVTRAGGSPPRTVAAGATMTDPAPVPPSYPRVLAVALGSSPTAFVPAVSWRRQTAVWISRSPSGVALLSFDQRLVGLGLYHSGTVDAGGWHAGVPAAGTPVASVPPEPDAADQQRDRRREPGLHLLLGREARRGQRPRPLGTRHHRRRASRLGRRRALDPFPTR